MQACGGHAGVRLAPPDRPPSAPGCRL